MGKRNVIFILGQTLRSPPLIVHGPTFIFIAKPSRLSYDAILRLLHSHQDKWQSTMVNQTVLRVLRRWPELLVVGTSEPRKREGALAVWVQTDGGGGGWWRLYEYHNGDGGGSYKDDGGNGGC
ncbi:hypothetical protein L1987_83757 [Smallanthus sonchifolius]|uniref:Uncharacterized protein n=2 Tax=Smallanthus sonchifolius TaxID=185202 RepID=A0ACB8YDQ1_9ASTR|nr:hypothetical protein L1987_83749 [Smallanthus sonchifolius]KAI3683255.1 hypothetical protein L1987_83757 [Smallanthus sonchifolius]